MSVIQQLSHEMVLSMMAHLVRFPSLFKSFKDHIKPTYFREDNDPSCDFAERPMLYIWKGLLRYYDSQIESSIPSKELLTHYVKQALSADQNNDTDMQAALFDPDETYGYIAYIYSPERDSLNAISGKELLQQFLVERGVANEFMSIARTMAMQPDSVDTRIGESLNMLSENAKKISTLGATVVPVPTVPDDDYYLDDDDTGVVSSGIPFLDNGLGGGQRRGAVNGILGCTSAGKTTLGLQIVASNSMVNRAEVAQGLPQELCLFYSFEQSASDILPTLQSNAMNIGISSLRPRRNLSVDFNTKKEYEHILWPDPQSWVPEQTRWEENRDWLNSSIIVQNFSGVPDKSDKTDEQILLKRNRGTGGVDEIQNDVEQLIALHKKDVRVIVIDYAGLVVYRQYGATSEDRQLYTALAYMGDECRKKLAGRFNCVVWLLHQIAGAANGLSPLIPLTADKAAGCKSFADNIDTCLCLGNPDAGDADLSRGKCLYATFSKTRFTGGNGFDAKNRILQHNAFIRRLDDVSDQYAPDVANKCFAPRSELRL